MVDLEQYRDPLQPHEPSDCDGCNLGSTQQTRRYR